jgi:hypothetical protein
MNMKMKVRLKILVVVLAILTMDVTAQVDCNGVPACNSTTEYIAGNQATDAGSLYQAKWWTRDEKPSLGNVGEGKPWELVGPCGGNETGDADWKLNGNAGTTATHFLGTTGSQPLVIKTNNTEALRVLPNGYVGIGNNNPQARLDVNGSIYTSGLRVGLTSTPGYVLTSDANGNASWQSSSGWSLAGNNITGTSQFLGTTNFQPLILKANNVEGLRIATSGAVNIGTGIDNFYYKFEVNGARSAFMGPLANVNQNNLLVIYSGNNTTASAQAGFRHYMGFSHALFPDGKEYGIFNAVEFNVTTNTIRGKHILMQNNNEGNLGIGNFTSAPSAKLHVNGSSIVSGTLAVGETYVPTGFAMSVNGKLVATEVHVKLRNKWPDFIFDSSFKLRTLPEIEQFIKENKHLPDVPSAKEVEEKGISLGEMDAALLQQIEQLTLQNIAQQKQIEALMKRLEEVEKRK